MVLAQDFLSREGFDNFKENNFFYSDKKTEITPFDVSDDEKIMSDQELWQIISQKLNQKTWDYKVKRGDTLWSLSKKFKVKVEDLMILNNLKSEKELVFGMKIKIPGNPPKIVETEKSSQQVVIPGIFRKKYVAALAQAGDLLIPVSGFNWGEKHGYNATDIAAPCGEPVYAAQEGYVVISQDGWNGGYGNYVVIYHQNFSTLYGHLSLRTVEEGEYVEKGDLIGYVGNTGKTKGATGCHLHFEVRGRSNPLLR